MANQKLDRLDKQILRLIAEDARIPFLEVARACGFEDNSYFSRFFKKETGMTPSQFLGR